MTMMVVVIMAIYHHTTYAPQYTPLQLFATIILISSSTETRKLSNLKGLDINYDYKYNREGKGKAFVLQLIQRQIGSNRTFPIFHFIFQILVMNIL